MSKESDTTYKDQPSGVIRGGGGGLVLLYINYLGKRSEKSMVLGRFGLKVSNGYGFYRNGYEF